MDKTPIVSIVSIVYNQAPYIRKCLEGFLMQETDFPFEIIIHDDASTDGTPDIIKEFAAKKPDLFVTVLQSENQYSKHHDFHRIITSLISEAKGKYIAFCEGDDYWIDPLKLQKQFDFLENNPHYGMCFTDFDIKNEETGKYTKSIFKNFPIIFPTSFQSPEDFILRQTYVCPPSWFFRKEIFPKESYGSQDATFIYFSHFLYNTKVKYLDFTSCVYRILKESASHSNNFDTMYKRMQNILQTKLRLIDHYKLNPDYKELCIENHYRLNLVDLIIHHKNDDVKTAEKILRNKSIRDKMLLAAFNLHLSPLVKVARKIKPAKI